MPDNFIYGVRHLLNFMYYVLEIRNKIYNPTEQRPSESDQLLKKFPTFLEPEIQ